MVDYSDTQLGQETRYSDEYDPLLLCPIPRAKARQQTEQGALAFMGTDIWTAFEISWLNPDGLPHVAIGEFSFLVLASLLLSLSLLNCISIQ